MWHANSRINVRSTVCGFLTCCLLMSSMPSRCVAQNGEDIAKGLLKALIESQLDKSRRRSGGRDTLRPPNGSGSPIRPQPTRQIQQLRPISASLAQESATMVALLQSDSRRSLGVRSHLADAIRLQANASALRQRVSTQNNHLLVQDDFRSFNSDWSTLSHQLNSCKGVGVKTKACVKRIAALDGQYCSLLDIQEQFNSQELVRAAYTLTNYNKDLIDDVRDMHRPGSQHRQVLRNLASYSQKAEYFASLVSQGTPYPTAVSTFQDAFSSWTNLEPQLADYRSHGLARSLRRIQDSNRDIHGLLRISMGVDKNHVLHLVHTISDEMTDVFRSMTLEEMMTLPDGQALPDAADAVSGTIQNLDDLVHRDENPQAIAEAWVYADEAWREFQYYASPSKSPQTGSGLRHIAEAMNSLKVTLGVNVAYDPALLVQTASSLEFLTSQLLRAVQKWQRRPGQHDANLPRRIQQLESALHQIEQNLASGRGRLNYRQECDQAIALWQQIRPALKTCDTDERVEFDHIAARITSEGIKLRTMLDE